MSSADSAKRLFELNLLYSRKMEQSGDHVIMRGEDLILYLLLEEDGPLLSGELTKRMELTSGRTANILNSLEKKGLIRRKKDSADKRQVSVSLTSKGRKQITALYQDCIGWHQEILNEIGEKDANEFLRIAEQILGL